MTKLLILIVVVLGILAIAQLARVYELTARLRGKREEEISTADNRMNATLMLTFLVAYFVFFLWLILAYKDKMLPLAASEQGVETDWLMNFNWVLLGIAFVITNVLLFYFAFKYVYSKDRRAFWQPHNNKLELIWTIVPAAVLAVIIIYGLNSWNKITAPASPDAQVVELYAKQFDWTARYPGADGMLGATDFRLINGTNPLGIVTEASIATRLAELEVEKRTADSLLHHGILPDDKMAELEERVGYLGRMSMRVRNLRTVMEQDIKANGEASAYLHGSDDVVTKDFMLPLNKEALMLIRSQDVLHSVFIPHLRVQMNAVPGMTTQIKVVPTITSDSMRTHVMRDPDFNFVLLCNKICGASHYNMQMPLMVVSGTDFDTWVKTSQEKPFEGAAAPAAPATIPADSTMNIVTDSMAVAVVPATGH
ncbi:MAG: cytochrome c oxidase subunit II [Flavobacteriales bacterium]|nr:cytochrome c oxidase subunit II [Flavobacteriales bacterium]